MPTYVYECSNCKQRIELVQKITEKTAPLCMDERCSLREMDTVIVPFTFVLKGSGWAKDGYSGGKK